MERRRIGSLEVSAVGLGCNSFGEPLDQAAAATVVDAALDAGIDFFDTADSYGGMRSEEFLGRALGKRRDTAVIATKFGMPLDEKRPGGARPEYVRQALEESLRRLQTDRIDLYQLHTPDPTVPIEETLGALDELVAAGKVREIGCSNHSADQLREAAALMPQGRARFVSVQNEEQRTCFSKLLTALKDNDGAMITVPSIALAHWDGKVNEIRAMKDADMGKANQIAGWLRGLGFEVDVVNLTGRWSGAKRVRPNTFEIWFGDAPLPPVCTGKQAFSN